MQVYKESEWLRMRLQVKLSLVELVPGLRLMKKYSFLQEQRPAQAHFSLICCATKVFSFTI